jgi:O-methyltransferase
MVQIKSQLSQEKLTLLIGEIDKRKKIFGCMAEVGCYNFGTAKLMSLADKESRFFLYDSLGVIEAETEKDQHKNGDFVGEFKSESEIYDFMRIEGKDNRVIVRLGKFPDTFAEWNSSFKIVHSDTDTYFGTKATIQIFENRLTKGGIIIFDDYSWPMCQGVTRAIDEYSGALKKIKISKFQVGLSNE